MIGSAEFIHSLDLVKARPIMGLLTEQPEHTVESVFGVGDRDFAVYLADARERDEPDCGAPIGGAIRLDLPEGEWLMACYSPVTGQSSPAVGISGGAGTRMELPVFEHDIVVRFSRA